MNPYSETDADVVDSYGRVHGNSEQTHVAILGVGGGYVAVAYDIDPREYSPVAADVVAFDPTLEGAEQRAERWMDTHPKGILGGDNDSGSGVLSKVMGGLKRVNDYGNDLAVQQPPQDQEESKHE